MMRLLRPADLRWATGAPAALPWMPAEPPVDAVTSSTAHFVRTKSIPTLNATVDIDGPGTTCMGGTWPRRRSHSCAETKEGAFAMTTKRLVAMLCMRLAVALAVLALTAAVVVAFLAVRSATA